MNFQSVNTEHSFAAVCVCYAYAVCRNLLSFVIYHILLFCGTYVQVSDIFLPGAKIVV